MNHKTITVSEFVKGNLESGTVYSIAKDKPLKKRLKKRLKYKLEDWLKDKGLDSYSRSVKRDYKKGITNDLRYKNTLDKCSNIMPIRLIWVDKYTTLVNKYNEDDIDKELGRKINKLINDNKVGYVDCDSNGCYLACRQEDYINLCKHLGVEYDERDDNKEFYYNSLFDDIMCWFNDNGNGSELGERVLYDIVRYIVINIWKYTDILLSAREWSKKDSENGEFWVDVLWNKAYKDYKNNDKEKDR